MENPLVRCVFNIYVIYYNIFYLTGGFNSSKELNNVLKQGNECLTNNVLFVLPEFEVSIWHKNI